MPQVEPAKHRSKRTPVIIGVVALLVVAAIVVLAVALTRSKPDTTAASNAVLESSQAKLFKGQKDEAIADLKHQIEAAKTDEEKLMLYTTLGSAYETLKDNKAALGAYKSADSIQNTYGTNMSVGRLAEVTGDKVLALERYKRALNMIKDGKAENHEEDTPDVEAAIKRVEVK